MGPNGTPDVLSTHCQQLASIDYLRKNWGVLIALAIMYLSFGTMLLVVRMRRARESYAYLAYVALPQCP
jgi:hypothetical protein